MKLFEAQFSAVGRPPITPELHLDEKLPLIQADATLLHRAIENLVLNAMDAMPAGGVLMLRTMHTDGHVRLEVSDTGAGLDAGRMRAPVHALLHDQAARHGARAGDRAIGGERSRRPHFRRERNGRRNTSFHIDLPRKVRPSAPRPIDLPEDGCPVAKWSADAHREVRRQAGTQTEEA